VLLAATCRLVRPVVLPSYLQKRPPGETWRAPISVTCTRALAKSLEEAPINIIPALERAVHGHDRHSWARDARPESE
jgi:hypothetical protein